MSRPPVALPERMRASGYTDPAFARLGDLAHAIAGLTFPPNRQPSAEAGMRRAMATLGLRDATALYQAAEVQGDARDVLLGELTVGESYFFRDATPLNVVAEEILPARARGHASHRPLRVWSAGCASGEEPYTIAILLRELRWTQPVRIVGTDVALARLAAARRGRYTRWALRGVSEARVQQWFTQAGSTFDINGSIRDSVEFEPLNLIDGTHAPIGGQFDLVLCRNVLIYFELDVVARIAQRLLDALDKDGWLLLGASDPPLADLVSCQATMTANGMMYRRPGRKGTPARARPVVHARTPVPALAMPVVPVLASVTPAPVLAVSLVVDAALADPEPQCDDDLGDVAAELASLYLAADYPAVEALATRALCARPGDESAMPAWVFCIRAVANQGRLHEAGTLCARALELHSLAAELHVLHATLLAQAQWHADAAIAARRAIYLDRRFVMAHMLLGDALSRSGEGAGARRAYENVIELLAGMSDTSAVPGSDGVPATRLRQAAEFHVRGPQAGSPR